MTKPRETNMSLRYKLADWISGGDLSAFDKLAADLHTELERLQRKLEVKNYEIGEWDDMVKSAIKERDMWYKQVHHLERGLLNIINSTNGIKQGTAQRVNRQAKHILAHMPRGE